MKPSLLILTNSIAGLHSFRKEVMMALIDGGYEVYISEPDDDERKKYFESIGCHIIKTVFARRGLNPLADIKLMLKYRSLIKQLRPIAVLSYTIKPNIYGGIVCRLTKTIQLANITGLGDAIENGGWLQWLTIGLYRFGLGKAKRVFFQNSTNRDFCVNKGIADDTSILLPGSGVNLKHHVLQEYPSDGCIRFLYIARLQKDKGVGEYFEAARAIKKKYGERVEFQVLGSKKGDFEKEMDDLDRNGIVRYLGKTSDVRPYLKEAHCTIMPSYHEGMSNVNLESAATGRPVITTNVPGCRETVDDGLTGFMIAPKSTRSLVEAIEKFIHLPYDQKIQMGIAGRKKVEAEFNRQIVVEAYLMAISMCHQ